ncbi:NADP-dependent oxidoreductase [Gordonia asplenii]|uniref:NADP-dependent oxidoreductase n=1 Tax=Gordonia asplenii TaxID=2725283 RepID=UPI001B7D6BF1|nr:NADP-dependent oxidoreductase [Gordonia asplenii]
MGVIGREVVLERRPARRGDFDCFDVVERRVPDPLPGQVVIASTALSVDPSMIPRLTADTYAPKFTLGRVIESRAVGRVVSSADDRWAHGDWVVHSGGWREFAVVDAATVTRIEPTPDVPAETWLGVLGAPGLTAFVGLDVARFTPDDVVWVSGAAGAVGSVAVQLAKARGARIVVGSAGGREKCRYLTEVLGVDVALDYRSDDLAAAILDVTGGIDLYFDNVGGSHLQAALATLNVGGRIAACGMVEGYGTAGLPAPHNLTEIITKRLTMSGLLVTDHLDKRPAFLAEAVDLVASGRLTSSITKYDGLDSAANAMSALLGDAAKLGKAVIDLT